MHPLYDGCVTRNHLFLVLAASILTNLFLSAKTDLRSRVTNDESWTLVAPVRAEQLANTVSACTLMRTSLDCWHILRQ